MIGRKRELAELERLYAERRFQLFILYGRRRVGKTTLLQEFCAGKEAIFFSAELSTEKLNLDKVSEQIYRHDGASDRPAFTAWRQVFHYLAERYREKRLVFVIDEFPYLAEGHTALLSELQHTIDHELQHTQLFLILCGSYVGFMEKEVLGSKSPLFGRRTAQLQLKPFDYRESLLFLDGFTPEEQLELYGALGGTAMYLRYVRPEKSVQENLCDLFLRPASYLYEEPIFLLKEEVRQPSMYNAVIEAIAGGASRASEIATKTGEAQPKCLKYIQTLIHLGILYKEVPFGEKETSRRTLYGISDFLFRFWYRYVVTNRMLIESGAQEILWKRRIAPDYPRYMGAVFERVCQQFLLHENAVGRLPLLMTAIGRWWGTDPATHQQEEIDLVASDDQKYLFGECKWRNEPTDLDTLRRLEYRANLFRKQRDASYYALFSKSGFTDRVRAEAAQRDDLLLYDLSAIIP